MLAATRLCSPARAVATRAALTAAAVVGALGLVLAASSHPAGAEPGHRASAVVLAAPAATTLPAAATPTPATPEPSGQVPPIVVGPTDTAPPPPPAGPADGPGLPGRGEDPGMFDLGGKIRQAIDGWFRDLVVSALNPVLRLLGRTVLATPDVTAQPRIRSYWGTTAAIANTCYVLLVVVGGAVVMGKETLQTRYALKDVAPRIVVGFVAANASLSIAHQAIEAANALSGALLGDGLDPESTARTFEAPLLQPLDNGGIFVVLLGLVSVVLAVVLLVTYLVRVVLVILMITAAPLALACHATPYTDGLARLWWRPLSGCWWCRSASR
jgi:hypothetical protein